MSFQSILGLIFQAILAYEGGQAEIEGGGTASSPAAVIGTLQGKPVYGWLNFSYTKPV